MRYGADLNEAKAQIGKMVGDGECMTLTKRVARLPHASLWHKGEKVKGNLLLKRGTIIATFDKEGRYTSDTFGQSHAAIYLGQDSTGIQVLDQFHVPDATVCTFASHRRRVPLVQCWRAAAAGPK
jgi:hypothetical protein